MGVTALCPGTFDPVTNGHLDIIERAGKHFDTLVAAVLQNPAKEPLFPLDERVAILKEAVAGFAGVEVDSFDGLLVDFARARGAGSSRRSLGNSARCLSDCQPDSRACWARCSARSSTWSPIAYRAVSR